MVETTGRARGRRPEWLPPRSSDVAFVTDVPFVQETPDVVRVLILQLARGAWSTLARLLQLACLTLDFKPLLAHEMANAGATGVVLDVLCQAPRHHPAWRALSTAGAGLLAALVRCEGGTEAAQPQALRMLLVLLDSDLTCSPARQAVATVLHCVVAQRTVHRDKLLAAGAVPVLLRVLRRLDVLCDVVAVQEVLWTLLYLTDDGALSMASAGLEGADEHQPAVSERLVPLLFLYGMPWHARHGHMAALTIRALHVQVAGYDAGKDTLRAAGTLSVLVDLVRRHSTPYIAAASVQQQGRQGRPSDLAAAAAPGAGRAHAATHGSFKVGPVRPPPHLGCDMHADGSGLPNGTAGFGPYSCGTTAALGPWTPWQRLLAVLLIQGVVPGLAGERRRRVGGAAGARGGGVASPAPGRGGADDSEGASTPSTLRSEAGSVAEDADVVSEEEDEDVFGSNVAYVTATKGADSVSTAAAAQPRDAGAAVVDGARLACYGLLLPLLVDAGEETAGGGGAAVSAVGGALLRRRLCPLRESLATLKTLLCDCEANQLMAAELGLVTQLVQLVAHGDMGLAWQAVEAAAYLSGGATGAALVAAGAAEEMTYLLQEGADALHGLTLRKQIQVQNSSMAYDHNHHNYQNRNLQRTASVGGGAGSSGGAAAAPAPLSAVHVRPNPNAHPVRPQRLYLVGRVPLDFTTSSSCFYGSHDAASYCDYCTPSAAIKVLLRLMAAAAQPPPQAAAGASPFSAAAVAPEAAVCRRFMAAGGLYGVLLLLHHEAAGVHHSKLAASLLTLLDLVLVHAPGAQDQVRTAGGLGVLTTLLGSLMRPGVMDVYQLRVATCRTLGLMLQGNAANKLAAREQGLLPLLVSMVTVLAQQRKSSSSELVVDDNGPLASACLDALAASARDSPGTQEALVALGLMHPVCELLRDDRLDAEARTAAVRMLTALVDEYPAGQAGALTLGVVPSGVAWLGRCCNDAAAAAAAGHRGGNGGVTGVNSVEAAAPAVALTTLLAALLRGGNAQAKAAVVAAGSLPVLLQLLRVPAPAMATISSTSSAGPAPASAAELAAGVLAVLVDGDTDLQNELVAQGALAAAAEVIRQGGAAAPQALQLLSAVLRSNTFVKNMARHAGVPDTLVAAVRGCGLARSGGAAAAAVALTELAAGNHANQHAVAMQGGLEVAVDLAREAFVALPLGDITGGGGAAIGTLEDAAGDSSDGVSGDGESTRGSDNGLGLGSEVVAAAAEAEAAVEAAAACKSLSRLLRALFGLLCACVELNGGNKDFVRELGGVGLLGDFLLTAAEALTSPPPQLRSLQQLPYGRRRQRPRGIEGAEGRFRGAVAAARAALSPAVAAACSALAALVRESAANLARLEEQSGLAVALFKLLVATDAATSCAAAIALEWLVVRSRAQLDAPSREIFERDLVDVLVLALYVPYAAPSSPHAAASADALGYAAAPQRQQQQQYGPWHVAVTSLMPSEGLTGPAVRDAAAVLTAVADAADALEVQQQQQPRRPPPSPPPSQQQQTAKASMAKATPAKVAPTGSLPALQSAPLDAIASDHTSGLMVSNSLYGQPTGGGGEGPGSQSWWAELAGSAAAVFQRVANGALQDTTAWAGASASGGSTAGAAPPPQQASAAATAAQERRWQVAWMLFLLAARSPDNRARIRRLVRTSLTPLAQQLINAEVCRAQLEAAAAGPGDPGSGSGAGPAVEIFTVSSAALESASSLKGRLPISTTAIEDLGGARRSSSASVTATFAKAPASQPPPPTQYQHPSSGLAQPPLPPHPNRRRSSSSGAAQSGPTAPAVLPNGGSNNLHGDMYGNAPAAPLTSTPPSSIPATPRDTYLTPADADGAAAAVARRVTRLNRTASGSGPLLPSAAGFGGSAATAAGSDASSATCTPRISLTGAVAAAFAPQPGPSALYPGGNTPGARGSRGPSPNTSRPSLFRGSALEGGAPGGSRMAGSTPTGPAAAAAAGSSQRQLHAQVSGGGSSVMSDDDEMAMIQQEVALLANTTSVLTWSAGVAGVPGAGGAAAGLRGGHQSGGSGNSPASSPARWGPGRR